LGPSPLPGRRPRPADRLPTRPRPLGPLHPAGRRAHRDPQGDLGAGRERHLRDAEDRRGGGARTGGAVESDLHRLDAPGGASGGTGGLAPLQTRPAEGGAPRHPAARPDLRALRRDGARGFLAQDCLASVFTQATMTLLPLLVLGLLGSRESAYFAIPFMIVVAFDNLGYGSCAALVVEASPARGALPAGARP